MTNESRRRRQSIPSSTTAASEGRLILANTHSEKQDDKSEQIPKNTETSSNSDCVHDLYSSIKGGEMKQTKQCTNEILNHDRSTSELKSDGTNVITPHPRQQLPNEIVSLILMQLSEHLYQEKNTLFECTLVSKQFQAIVDPLLWQLLDFADTIMPERFIASISDTSPQRLSTLGQHIHELHLAGRHWTDEQLTRLLPHIPNLKRLSINTDACITDKGFQQLPYFCQQLITLCLPFTQLTYLSFSAVGQHCHQLSGLQWDIWDDQSAEWLELLLRCPLKYLIIWTSTEPLNEKAIMSIKKFHHLDGLEFSDETSASVNFLLQQALETNTTTTTPSTPWPSLTMIELAPCYDIDDTTLIGFIKTHPHLQELTLWQAKKLTDASLDAIAAGWLPNVTHVSLGDNANISSNAVRRLVYGCPDLEFVELYRCREGLANDIPELSLNPDKGLVLDQEAIHKIKASGRRE